METTGKIIKILDVQSGKSKNGEWKKQEFILQTDDKYPKNICFELWGDKIDQFEIHENDEAKVLFDLESREYNGRWYTNARVWSIEKTSAVNPSVSDDYPDNTSFSMDDESTDDLPF